jgi:4-hydroxyproline epimerase
LKRKISNMTTTLSARIIDSHTGGEPTRIVVEGGPNLRATTMAQRVDELQRDHDAWRRALAREPRGNDVIVGAYLCPPVSAGSACGVVFFNNVGYLGMCGHGTIGLVATLAYLGRIQSGAYDIDTPVGTVRAELHTDGSVTVGNVPSYRLLHHVGVDVPGFGRLHGDVAWGGNWFFICGDHSLALDLSHLPALNACTQAIRKALVREGITGADGAEIDHIELTGPAQDAQNHARNFVLCPGMAYDRSPCGTGTSAKLACLAADQALAPGAPWRQESVIGSVFRGHYQSGPPTRDGQPSVMPFIQGRAHVTLDARMVVDSGDPFAWGIA